MIRIALCDDDRGQLDALVLSLKEYIAQHGIQLMSFSSAPALLNTVSGGEKFDLYLLDVVMPEMNGIELARKLRELGDKGLIIYLTMSPEFAVDSYQVKAFHYLLKPVVREELFSTLDRALGELNSMQSEIIIVRGKNAIHRLLLDDILYAETYNRCVRYHLSNAQTVDSLSLREPFHQAVQTLLEKPFFVPCGASFVVNLNFVSTMEATAAVFKDGTRLPLSKQACNSLRNAWMDYWLEGDKRWRF